MQSQIKNHIATFLHKTFTPVRLIFPKIIKCKRVYDNALFHSSIYQSAHFGKGFIETPGMYMAKILGDTKNDTFFVLKENTNAFILDTMGQIPARYVYMLKDFVFKNEAQVDFNSDKKICENEEYWKNCVSECPDNILKKLATETLHLAERQTYKIKVHDGPPYFKINEWYTYDQDASLAAQQFFNKSSTLYSIGNIDPRNEYNKHKYHQLSAAGGGISMTYANNLPWQTLRKYIHQYSNGVLFSSGGYTDTRGWNTYDQRKDLSVEEIVILHEFLKAEGAKVELLNVNGIKDHMNKNECAHTINK